MAYYKFLFAFSFVNREVAWVLTRLFGHYIHITRKVVLVGSSICNICCLYKIHRRTADAAGGVAPAQPPPAGTLFAESTNLRKCSFAYCAHNRIKSLLYMVVNTSHTFIFFWQIKHSRQHIYNSRTFGKLFWKPQSSWMPYWIWTSNQSCGEKVSPLWFLSSIRICLHQSRYLSHFLSIMISTAIAYVLDCLVIELENPVTRFCMKKGCGCDTHGCRLGFVLVCVGLGGRRGWGLRVLL